MATAYDSHPYHPLHDVPDEILEAARAVLQGAVEWHDVDPDMADPIADAVVMALLPWMTWMKLIEQGEEHGTPHL